MKLILSRKGFDSTFDDIASPILPDGTLLSLPIPLNDNVRYDELYYGGQSYLDIINQLKTSNIEYKNCHLDPDIRKDIIKRDNNWMAAFGQSDSAYSHLRNQSVDKGDIFLFFGWFKQTEYDAEGKLKYVDKALDLQVIYGYLQVGEKLTKWDDIKELKWHPHSQPYREELTKKKKNVIYVASNYLLDTKQLGYGTLKFTPDLVLTKKCDSCRTHWTLPKCLEHKNITYHSEKNYKDGYFKAASRGQEFVVECDKDILDWIKNIILTSSGH